MPRADGPVEGLLRSSVPAAPAGIPRQAPALISTRQRILTTLDAGLDPHTTLISRVMSSNGKHIGPDALAVEAAQLMELHSIQGLLVIDEEHQLVGALNFQDLLKAGVV